MPPIETPTPTLDYPAAHSMDTTWYAVDANGEIGKFDSTDDGSVPLLADMEPPDEDYGMNEEAADRYYEIKNYIEKLSPEETFDPEEPSEHVHCYATAFSSDSFYYWRSSPPKALTIDELPERFRSDRYLLKLRDYDFRSREPVDPSEHARQCYRYWSGRDLYPYSHDATRFPHPSVTTFSTEQFRHGLENLDPMREGILIGRAFFAQDDAGFLALFRTDRFGAIPCMKRPDQIPELSPGRQAQLSEDELRKRRYQFAVRKQFDMAVWEALVSPAPGNSPHPFLIDRRATAESEWQEHGPVHWLEYPFLPLGGTSPRLYGLYLFDASWHRPLPYVKIATPTVPLNIRDCPDDLIDRMKPVNLPGVHFAQAELVQPHELLSCYSISPDYNDEVLGWQYPSVWIDSRLTSVHSCYEFLPFCGSAELLLRRARRHILRVQSLSLPRPG